ncbi:hypothetical protein V6S02_06010 [Microbacterium sp. CCNWLW134]|uniref:hypothetical protein n=1 Tax=Microbacterium sp. CCNWLW134 TaxID=3122064 RepID=UPI00300FEFDC
MIPHVITTATCKGCNPWVRVIAHPTTNQPIAQELHEDTCHVWPKLTRSDRGGIHAAH